MCGEKYSEKSIINRNEVTMKYMNMLINGVIIACYVGNIISYPSATGYSDGNIIYGSAIGGKANQIRNRFINVSSRNVITKKLPLSKEFKEFLYSDKMMQKIEKINQKGKTEATLDTTALEENIDELLHQKEYELGVARNNCSTQRKVCIGVGGAGIAVGLLLIVVGNSQAPRSKQALENIGGGIGLISLLGAFGLSYLIEKEEVLEQHIEQIKIMRDDWKKFFAIP